MKICLDTNAYSDFIRGVKGFDQLFSTADEIIVPAIVIGELQYGFLLGRRAAQNEDLLSRFLAKPGVVVQPVTRDVAERFGYVKAALKSNGHPIPENDIWIAATALETGARLVTRDAHFDAIGGLIRIVPS